MVDFYSPKPSRPRRGQPEPGLLAGVRLSSHATLRSDERCGLTEEEFQQALDETALPLKAISREDRTYRLLFEPRQSAFFIVVIGHDTATPTAVTVLTQVQYEADRGRLPADLLRTAAARALPAVDFHVWAAGFDWAAQRLDRRDLNVRAGYRLADGADRTVDVPVNHPVQSEVLAGGNLDRLLDDDAFLYRLNVDLYAALGTSAPEAIAHLTSLEVTYGPYVVFDLLATAGPQLLSRFESRRVTRSSLKLFVTFAHDEKIHQTQKSRPSVPDAFMFENLLPDLKSSVEFLTGVKDHIAKLVPPHDLLSALQSISELQICVDGRAIDLVTADDCSAVHLLMEIA